MNLVIAKPFANSVAKLMSSMMGIDCRPLGRELPIAPSSISGIISMSGCAYGQVVLSFPRETASLLVAEMIGLEVDEVDDETLTDGVGEMTNIVVGNAKAELSATNQILQMSLPRVVAGADDPVFGDATAAQHFETDLGAFSMYFSLVLQTGVRAQPR